MAHGRHKMVP